MREIVFLREVREICRYQNQLQTKMVWKTLETCHRYVEAQYFQMFFYLYSHKKCPKSSLFFSFCCSSFNRLSYKKSLDFADFELDMIRISRSSPSFCNKKLNLFFGIWQSIEVICKTSFRSWYCSYFCNKCRVD